LPGSLGVFDAAIVGLSQFEGEELLAELLVSMILYYIVPFAISPPNLGVRELTVNTSGKARSAAAETD
jgi:hypothetical protein